MVGGKNRMFVRNAGIIGRGEQRVLKRTRLGIVGLGGTGGAAFECCVRNGFGKFVIFDPDSFQESNFNRQIYADYGSKGVLKVSAAIIRAKNINPSVEIEGHAKRIGGANVRLLGRCGVVVDCTDNLSSRKTVSAFCRKAKIPYVFCSAGGSSGMVSVFQAVDVEGVMLHAKGHSAGGVLAQAAIMAGTLASAEALAVVLGRTFVEAPEFLFFDLFSERAVWKHKI